MEKEYTINWLEKKTTSTGKAYVAVTLEGEEGKTPTIWSDFPNFANLMPGVKITGELKQNDKGYWNVYPPRSAKTTQGASFKQKLISDVMEKKEASIERFQGNKEESIRLMAAQRDAVLIVTNLLPGYSNPNTELEDYEDVIRCSIIRWRNWFLSEDFQSPPF